jgi:hypothetical protein
MIPKREPPTVITLNKTSSGTLEFRKAPKRHFKPWQRLWLVTGIIYLLMLAGGFYLLMPNRESIERGMVFSVTEEVRRYDGMAFAGKSPRKIFEIARSQGYPAWITSTRSKFRIGPEGNAGFERIETEYREAISNLPVKRSFGFIFYFVFWLVPMAVLYSIGFVVDWIKRGANDIQE